ncbi:MAG: choice-of-anchor L domain-containing protein, partial [Flavobacteriaceae bacterium]|nr:choice-of-anchor L domain-containing protein [Flavobacteriaceae bacterium]
MKTILRLLFLFGFFAGWSQADLVVTKTDGSNTYTAGETLTYTITLTNNGPDDAVNVHLEDIVPDGIDPDTVNWTGDNGTSGVGDLIDDLALLPVGVVIVYEVIVPIPSDFDQATDLVNTVVVTSDTPDPDPDCPECTDTNTPNPLANLVTVKTNGQTQYVRGETVTYTITIVNQGPSDAWNVVVSDPLPNGISIMSWSGTNGSSGTGALLDNIPVFANGETVVYTVEIFVPITFNINSNLVNTVIVSSDTPDPVPACPQCTDTDTPAPRYVTISATQYTVPQLVQDVLIDSDCAQVSNFTFSGSGTCAPIGYFKKNNSNFPFKEGVIIRTGNATLSQGHYNGGSMSDNCPSGSTDAGLQALAASQGQTGSINNAAFIQFNFTPLTDNFSFNFLFASNEYGTFQCGYTDVFAFFLTNLDTGVTTNLAVVPGTTTPISVTTIRNQAHNASCASSYPEYFGQFNQAMPMLDTPINMVGQTVVMTAASSVIPNNNYRIRLVIGDYLDDLYDSAVFIEAGSFNVGTASLEGIGEFEGFGDFTIENGTALCSTSDCRIVQAGTSPISIADYTWTHNGVVIPGANTYQLEVCEPGEYQVTISIGGTSGCTQVDTMIVEMLPPPDINDPDDLTSCTNIFDLTDNETLIANGLVVYFSYHHSQAEAILGENPIPNVTNYSGTDGETIYVSITISGIDCPFVSSFQLIVLPCSLFPLPTDIPPLCDIDGDGFEVFDLTISDLNALNGLDSS